MSFKIDEVNKETITISTDTLEKHGYESAAELVQTVMDNVENEDEQTESRRRFERGYNAE
jgi:hypothetical protein